MSATQMGILFGYQNLLGIWEWWNMKCKICGKDSGFYYYCTKKCSDNAEAKGELYMPLDRDRVNRKEQRLDGLIIKPKFITKNGKKIRIR